MEEKISIIVPVYNVEKYIRKCVDSICGQTYGNLEIILVDDGSTDSSGMICDQYEKKDTRIVVVHKQNGGLSDARNAGMEVATGSYIGFVDSDDWIEPNMYERLLALCESEQLDVAAACFVEEYESGVGQREFSDETLILNGLEMLKINVFGHTKYLVTNSVWDRLYKREILKGLLFPVGQCYEDMCFSVKVFLRANRCGLIHSGLYHYRIRENSIMGSGLKNQNSFHNNVITDLLPQMKEKAQLLYDNDLKILGDRCYYQYIIEVLNGLVKTYRKKDFKEQYHKLKDIIFANKRWISYYVRTDIEMREKIKLWLCKVSVPIYVQMTRLMRMR